LIKKVETGVPQTSCARLSVSITKHSPVGARIAPAQCGQVARTPSHPSAGEAGARTQPTA